MTPGVIPWPSKRRKTHQRGCRAPFPTTAGAMRFHGVSGLAANVCSIPHIRKGNIAMQSLAMYNLEKGGTVNSV